MAKTGAGFHVTLFILPRFSSALFRHGLSFYFTLVFFSATYTTRYFLFCKLAAHFTFFHYRGKERGHAKRSKTHAPALLRERPPRRIFNSLYSFYS